MYGCESWSIKKAEHWRTDAFELRCWRRFLRVPCTQGDQTNQSKRKSILNIHWKGWCWSWSSSTSAIWCEKPTNWKRPSCWERLRARGEGGDIGWDGWMASLTQWTRVWANSGRWRRTAKPGVRQFIGLQKVSQRGQSNWTIVYYQTSPEKYW